jgi:hypothetical protein
MVTVALVDFAGIELAPLARVLGRFVDEHLAPVWNVGCRLTVADEFSPEAWTIAFFRDLDQTRELGYHDLSRARVPFARISTASLAARGWPLSLIASHELAELLVNPMLERTCRGADGRVWAVEICDPVDEERFEVDGLPLSDFVYPAWFAEGSGRVDHLDRLHHPFQLGGRGYAHVRGDDGWRRLFGSDAKARDYLGEDRRGRRAERFAI